MPDSDAPILEQCDVMVPMRDGIRLRTDIFQPGSDGPFPVLTLRYPYSPRDGIMSMFARQIAGQGYAVVIQSCRGRFGSEGDFYPFHPDVDDSYDTVEWAADQPWSNGRVGMFGVSYSGMTQWTAALARPPHLVCMAPALCTWNWTVGGWYAVPGVMTLGLVVLWSAQMTAYEAERRELSSPLPAFAEVARIGDEGGLGDPDLMAKMFEMQPEAARPLIERRPLRDIEEFRVLASWFRDFCDHEDPADSYWSTIDASSRALDIDLPILHITGWYDYFTRGALDAYVTLSNLANADQARHGQRLIVGPWNHNAGQIRPDADPSVWIFFDFSPASPTMAFFEHHLKGNVSDYETHAPVRIYVMGENAWRDENEWPLERTQWTTYFLHGHASLGSDPQGDEPPLSFVYDPEDPVPGSMAPGVTYNDPIDLNSIIERDDVLAFTTHPFSSETEVTGPVSVELWASTSAPSTDFTAKLVEIFSDGFAVPLCQGIVRIPSDGALLFVPNAVYRYIIEMAATSVLLKPGHRLQLHISSSEYPTYELNPNTGKRITHDTKTAIAHQQIFCDRLHPSRLILPIIPR
jgi:uncharacterized protein